jgi:aminopeptidase N
MYGAMENTTATIYGDFYQQEARALLERSYVSTNAHELAHQWFGDYITEYSAQHHWLHESFATYYAKQFCRQVYGEDFYEFVKRDEANSAIRADAADRYPVAHTKGGSARHYPKGSFVIDMLRYVVGDSVYRKCITNYLKKHAYSNVSNHDFMFAFMETAGVNLDWFFDQWVYRAGIPNYNVSYERQTDRVAFYVHQTQKVDELTSYFKMPIVFEVHFTDGSSSVKREWINREYDTVYVNAPVGKQISYVLFDPASNVLKTVTFNKTVEELKSQALNAKHMLDRYDALVGLQSVDVDAKRDFLHHIFYKGDFHMVLTEVIAQLAFDRNPNTVQLFKNALHNSDFLVRRAVVEKLTDYPQEILLDVEELLSDTSYITIETTLRKLCKSAPEKAMLYLEKVKDVKGISNNVRITYLELSLRQNPSAIVLQNELVKYTSNSFEFRTRVKAIEAIERLQICNSEIISNLFNACLFNNNRLNGPASRALRSLLVKPENREIAKSILELTPWKDWERKILESIVK